jgi:hypothetical protein
MPPAPTLDGRLICACNCAYDVKAPGPLPTPPGSTYYDGAGFTTTPTAFVSGDQDIDACLVGTTPDGVVLAFRGTLTFDFSDRASLRDWLNNFAARPVTPNWLPPGSGAGVHSGFLASLEGLVSQGALTEVNRQLQAAGSGAKLLITGHSKGGAAATLAALRVWTTDTRPSQVVTFAAPRCGDRAFADVYNNARILHTRYEFQDDIVPHAPPTFGSVLSHLNDVPWLGSVLTGLQEYDYESVGNLRFIDWSNQPESDSTWLDLQRLLSLARVIVDQQWDTFLRDHQIGCKAEPGYMMFVCPTGVC